jgi:hypothetical protein
VIDKYKRIGSVDILVAENSTLLGVIVVIGVWW